MRKFSNQFSVISFQWVFGLAALLFFIGCATRPVEVATTRPFSFAQDTFAYANELKWEYSFSPDGKWSATRRAPPPEYSLHCFVVARSCRQFFQHARFDAASPKADEKTYQQLVRKVVSIDPRRELPEKNKIVIPGYANLRAFSGEKEVLLKEECGGAWQSYFQRGNWRMIFPFSRKRQEKTAAQLCEKIKAGRPPVAHIASFPDLRINHAIVLFDFTESENAIVFAAYDPNQPDSPTKLTFDRTKRTFIFPQNNYFSGGKVNVYEIYCSALY